MGHEASEPAPFLIDVADRIPSRGRPVLDLACGHGRNALALARRGHLLVALDRDPEALAEVRRRSASLLVDPIRADLESGHGIPLETGSCDAILVFRFLFRPLAAEIERVLAPGGFLVYETFTIDQRKFGHGPSNAAFLLEPAELAEIFTGLETLHHEEGRYEQPGPQAMARLLARKPARLPAVP